APARYSSCCSPVRFVLILRTQLHVDAYYVEGEYRVIYTGSKGRNTMQSARFTLGIEEEFQLVDRDSGDLRSYGPDILVKGAPFFGEKIKPEMLDSTVEFISDVLADLSAARTELLTARTVLSRLLHENNLALVSAGTHPSALWWEQHRT